MTALLLGALFKAGPWLLVILAGVAGVLHFGAKQKQAGRDTAIAEVEANNQTVIKEVADAEKGTAALSDAELARRLSEQQRGG